MGSGNSKEDSPSYRSASSSWASQPIYAQYGHESYLPPQNYASTYAYPQPSYHQETLSSQPYYPPTTSQTHGSDRKLLEKKYSRIADNYSSSEQVTEGLACAGLESSNLIVGIDFTKSNEWTGAKSFNRKSLHYTGNSLNPYEQAISIIGKTLAVFDEDNLIPCYGFGDASTHDQDVFSFYPESKFCNGFEEVLSRNREIVPQLRLAGPTSFALIIEMAMTIVEQSGSQYHVLVIIADGQVTRSVDTERGRLSPRSRELCTPLFMPGGFSKLPLSIILVGVGDGPWDMMKEFDDNIPARAFDNFQTKKWGYPRESFSPPSYIRCLIHRSMKPSPMPNFQPSVPSCPSVSKPVTSAPHASSSTHDNLLCPICLSNQKDMALGSGHPVSQHPHS